MNKKLFLLLIIPFFFALAQVHIGGLYIYYQQSNEWVGFKIYKSDSGYYCKTYTYIDEKRIEGRTRKEFIENVSSFLDSTEITYKIGWDDEPTTIVKEDISQPNIEQLKFEEKPDLLFPQTATYGNGQTQSYLNIYIRGMDSGYAMVSQQPMLTYMGGENADIVAEALPYDTIGLGSVNETRLLFWKVGIERSIGLLSMMVSSATQRGVAPIDIDEYNNLWSNAWPRALAMYEGRKRAWVKEYWVEDSTRIINYINYIKRKR
jgi:hypothetical protein